MCEELPRSGLARQEAQAAIGLDPRLPARWQDFGMQVRDARPAEDKAILVVRARTAQETGIGDHVTHRRIQPAIGDGSASVEIAPLIDQRARIGHRIALRAKRLEVIGRQVEIAVVHLQRLEDVLVDIGDIRLVADRFDHFAKDRIAEVWNSYICCPA